MFFAYDQKEEFDKELEAIKMFFQTPFYKEVLKEYTEETIKSKEMLLSMFKNTIDNDNFTVEDVSFGVPPGMNDFFKPFQKKK